MKRYLIRFPWHATVLVEVEAKNRKEAMAKAVDEAHTNASVCVHCSRHVEIDGDGDEEPSIEEIET